MKPLETCFTYIQGYIHNAAKARARSLELMGKGDVDHGLAGVQEGQGVVLEGGQEGGQEGPSREGPGGTVTLVS